MQSSSGPLKVAEVFCRAATPGLAFVDRDHLDEIRLLKFALAEAGVVACLAGESKSGKTTFLRKQLADTGRPFILLFGRRLRSVEDLWRTLGDALKLEMTTETVAVRGAEDQEKNGAQVEAQVKTPFFRLSGSAAGQTLLKNFSTTTFKSELLVSIQSLCLEYLRLTETIVVIDDFHLVPTEVAPDIAVEIKDAVSDGKVTFALISIPFEAFSFIHQDEQFKDRFQPFTFPNWSRSDLTKIVIRGFGLLGLTLAERQVEMIVINSQLSPYSLQEICGYICNNEKIISSADVAPGRTLSAAAMQKAFKDFSRGLDYFHTLLDPVTRSVGGTTTYSVKFSDPNSTKPLSSPVELNLFQLALLALSDAGVRTLSLRVMRKRIRARLGDDRWNNTHLKEVVRKLAELEVSVAYQKETPGKSRNFVLLDEQRDLVTIANPAFLSYLLWRMPEKFGLESRDLDYLNNPKA